MLLLSNAFAAISLILFFYSVIFVADTAIAAREAADAVRRSSTGSVSVVDRARTSRATLLLVLVDLAAVFQIVSGQTTNGVYVAPLVVMVAAGAANALYGLMAAQLV